MSEQLWVRLFLVGAWFKRLYDDACRGVAFRLLPRRVAYWATIRLGANATTGKWADQEVPDLAMADALKRWQ